MRNKALQKIVINLYNPDVTFSQEIIKNPRMVKIYFLNVILFDLIEF